MTTAREDTTPDEVIERLTGHFDHYDPEMTGELAFEVYRRLLAQPAPIWTEAHGGFGIVARYRDVIDVEKCPAVYSSAEGVDHPKGHHGAAVPIEFDDPIHADYRKLYLDLLNRRSIQATEPYIRTQARKLIDDLTARGGGDIMTDVALSLPLSVIIKLLGFSDEFRASGPEVFEEFLLNYGTDKGHATMARVFEMVLGEIRDLRREPRDCYLQTLLSATIQGRPITDDELINGLFTFVLAGYETTMGVMGSLTVVLGRDPELQDRLRNDPSLIAPAVEEALRLYPTLHSQFRTVTTPTHLHDVEFAPGDKVMLLLAAANRDPEVFEKPDEFRPERENVRQHLAFGFGAHLCAGNHLARAELRIFLETLLERCPPFRLTRDVKLRPFRMGHLLGWDHVPIEFTGS